jgi:serine/threonine protein kinase
MAESTAPPEAEGQLLAGRYRLGRVLGRGGMGTVWTAHDEMLGRDVAVKEVTPPPELTAEQRDVIRRRMLREARAAARISHPSAVTVYDVVEQDDRPWIVMQLLPPRTLADVVAASGPLPPAAVAAIGLDLVNALQAAHRAGVLHRDVKPANVMMADGRAVLTDFGIATVDEDPALTSTGMLVGSPAFMAPERARGERPTPASDLWSLGATLFAAVEGDAPFRRDGQLPTLSALLTEQAPPAVHAGPLQPVLAALLDRDPARRPDADHTRHLLADAQAAARRETTVPARVEAPPAPAPTATMAAPVVEPAPQPPSGPAPAPPPASTPPPADVPPPAAVPAGSSRGRRPVVAVVAAAVLLVGALAAAVIALRPDRPGDPAGSAAGSSPSASSSSSSGSGTAPSPAASTSPSPSASAGTPSSSASAGGSGTGGSDDNGGGSGGSGGSGGGGSGSSQPVPAGFRLYSDPTGFSVALPKGWTVSRKDGNVYVREPGTRSYLMIPQTTTPQPDALRDWQAQASSARSRFPGYRQLRLERVDYKGWDAADWEFTWTPSGGPLHVLNRNIRVNDRRAYALYWSVPASRWGELKPSFNAIAASFRPAR